VPRRRGRQVPIDPWGPQAGRPASRAEDRRTDATRHGRASTTDFRRTAGGAGRDRPRHPRSCHVRDAPGPSRPDCPAPRAAPPPAAAGGGLSPVAVCSGPPVAACRRSFSVAGHCLSPVVCRLVCRLLCAAACRVPPSVLAGATCGPPMPGVGRSLRLPPAVVRRRRASPSCVARASPSSSRLIPDGQDGPKVVRSIARGGSPLCRARVSASDAVRPAPMTSAAEGMPGRGPWRRPAPVRISSRFT
jgi:hypothetical protein